jgi:hypothetical protein
MISAYEHGQNAARHGKHIQTSPTPALYASCPDIRLKPELHFNSYSQKHRR